VFHQIIASPGDGRKFALLNPGKICYLAGIG